MKEKGLPKEVFVLTKKRTCCKTTCIRCTFGIKLTIEREGVRK